jgi:hypothetical protein
MSMLVVPLTISRVLFAVTLRMKNSAVSAISSSTSSMVTQAVSELGAIISVVSLTILASDSPATIQHR